MKKMYRLMTIIPLISMASVCSAAIKYQTKWVTQFYNGQPYALDNISTEGNPDWGWLGNQDGWAIENGVGFQLINLVYQYGVDFNILQLPGSYAIHRLTFQDGPVTDDPCECFVTVTFNFVWGGQNDNGIIGLRNSLGQEIVHIDYKPSDTTMGPGGSIFLNSVAAAAFNSTWVANVTVLELDLSRETVSMTVNNATTKTSLLANSQSDFNQFFIDGGNVVYQFGNIGDALGNWGLIIETDVAPPSACGDDEHPYPEADLNKNCYVDMGDLEIIVLHWLECTSPEPPCLYLP